MERQKALGWAQRMSSSSSRRRRREFVIVMYIKPHQTTNTYRIGLGLLLLLLLLTIWHHCLGRL